MNIVREKNRKFLESLILTKRFQITIEDDLHEMAFKSLEKVKSVVFAVLNLITGGEKVLVVIVSWIDEQWQQHIKWLVLKLLEELMEKQHPLK